MFTHGKKITTFHFLTSHDFLPKILHSLRRCQVKTTRILYLILLNHINWTNINFWHCCTTVLSSAENFETFDPLWRHKIFNVTLCLCHFNVPSILRSSSYILHINWNSAQYMIREQFYSGINETKQLELELIVSCLHNHSANL